jgi:regulator of sigma D
MLENCKNATERWGGVNDLIDKWLIERQELIVKFCDLTVNTPSSQENTIERLQGFCQVLVDYVSVGHFEIYEQLINEAIEFKNDDGTLLLESTIPQIQETTEVALDFNDSFDDIHKVDDGVEKLVARLERLGRTLENRFELEDQLIEAIHTSQADLVS